MAPMAMYLFSAALFLTGRIVMAFGAGLELQHRRAVVLFGALLVLASIVLFTAALFTHACNYVGAP